MPRFIGHDTEFDIFSGELSEDKPLVKLTKFERFNELAKRRNMKFECISAKKLYGITLNVNDYPYFKKITEEEFQAMTESTFRILLDDLWNNLWE